MVQAQLPSLQALVVLLLGICTVALDAGSALGTGKKAQGRTRKPSKQRILPWEEEEPHGHQGGAAQDAYGASSSERAAAAVAAAARKLIDGSALKGKRAKIAAAVAAPANAHGSTVSRGANRTYSCQRKRVTTPVAYRTLPSGERALLTWNRTSLADVLKRHVLPDNSSTVLMTTFYLKQDGSLDFLTNLFGNLEKLGLSDNLIAACAHLETCVAAWQAGIAAYLPWHGACPGKRPIWPTMLKWLLARHMLSLGYSVFFLDFDVGFKGPFLRYIDAVPHDVMVLSDYRGTDFFNASSKLIDHRFRCRLDDRYRVHPHACVSTGVFHLVASPTTVEFVTRIFNLSLTGGVWEQAAFNELLVYHSLPQPFRFEMRQRMRFELFPTPDYVNARLLGDLRLAVPAPEPEEMQRLEQRVTLVHCGYTHSLEDKKAELVREGVWVSAYAGATGPLPTVQVLHTDVNVLELKT